MNSHCCPRPLGYDVDLSRGLQHLTTFVLDRKDGMITVDDGVRRLRLLDAKGKVWTQEMLLQVEEKTVSLIDQETKVRNSLWVAVVLGSVPERTASRVCREP